MPKPVPDTEESMNVCRQFCGSCPSFKPNELNEFEPHALFCSRGQTTKFSDQVKNKGCICFGCELFSKYELENGFFCMPREQE
ncbi:MAG: DUF2769 domain-containing protein [Candidatus Hodarchaeota archaeon]